MNTEWAHKGTVRISRLEIPSVTFQATTWGEDFGLDIWGAIMVNISDADYTLTQS